MFSKVRGNGRQLVYCDCLINGGDLVFLDFSNEKPVSLFGGRLHAAAISDKGEVIFINRDAVKNSPNSRVPSVYLPNGEKASSVACLKNLVFVLSSNGRVFWSKVLSRSRVRFSPVSDLVRYEIIWLSGTDERCLAVSKEGCVFGFGSVALIGLCAFSKCSSLKCVSFEAPLSLQSIGDYAFSYCYLLKNIKFYLL